MPSTTRAMASHTHIQPIFVVNDGEHRQGREDQLPDMVKACTPQVKKRDKEIRGAGDSGVRSRRRHRCGSRWEARSTFKMLGDCQVTGFSDAALPSPARGSRTRSRSASDAVPHPQA